MQIHNQSEQWKHINPKFKIIMASSHLTFNPLYANPTKWSNTLKQFVAKMPANCLSVFDYFVIFAFKGLTTTKTAKASQRSLTLLNLPQVKHVILGK